MDYQPYNPPIFDEELPEEGLPGGAPGSMEADGHFVPIGLDSAPAGFLAIQAEDGDLAMTQTDADGVDFADIRLHRENTLLTNAERYAASIRLEAELYVKQMRAEVEELNAEAEKRYEEAATVKAEAEEQAANLVAEAQANVESITQQAHDEGFAAGEEAGLQKRYAEAGAYLEQLQQILGEMEQYRKQVQFYAEKDAIRLSLLMARQLVGQEVKTNKKLVLGILVRTLKLLEGKGTFRVWVSEADLSFAKSARPDLEKFIEEGQQLTFRAKPELAPGEVVIESDREVIDRSFTTQFDTLLRRMDRQLDKRETQVTRQRVGKPQGQPKPEASAPAEAPHE